VTAELRLLNEKGQSVSEFTSGQDIIFSIKAEFSESIEDFGLAVGVSNGNNPRIYVAYSFAQLKVKFSLKSTCECSILWKNNFLAPGLYEVNLTFYNKQSNYAWFLGIVTIKIIETDFWGTGTIVHSNEYLQTIAKCDWDIRTN
jgi:hypothetical protein